MNSTIGKNNVIVDPNSVNSRDLPNTSDKKTESKSLRKNRTAKQNVQQGQKRLQLKRYKTFLNKIEWNFLKC